MTIAFHGVFMDECGGEFGATIRAENKEAAWDEARDQYPESRCVQLESPEDTVAREKRIYDDIAAEYDDYHDEDYDDY